MQDDDEAAATTMSRVRQQMVRGIILGSLAITVIAASACSKTETADPSSSSTSTPAESTTTAPVTTTTQDRDADNKRADDALLVADDFDALPGTWSVKSSDTTTTSSPDGESSADDAIFESCTGIQDQITLYRSITKGKPTASSPNFVEATSSNRISNSVIVLASEENAVTLANIFGDDSFTTCLNDYYADQAIAEPSIKLDPAAIRVSRMKVGKLGDDHAVFEIELPFTIAKDPAHAVIAFVRVGRGYTSIEAFSDAKLTSDDVVPILDSAAAKLRRSLAS